MTVQQAGDLQSSATQGDKTSDQEDAAAQFGLGLFYEGGQGVPWNKVVAYNS